MIEQLDLVISVDTAIVHVAGALGQRVWTVLPFTPEWRWMIGREDSPWYPTMRLFRQKVQGGWVGLFNEVAQEMRRLTQERS
jgi:ADP-heptose:LPS heptosyltransferase